MNRIFSNSTRAPFIRGVFAACAFGVATGACAQTWTGNGLTQSWDDPANWNPTTVPVNAAASINAGTTEANPAVITNGVVATPSTLNIGASANTSGYLLVNTGGTLNPSSTINLGNSNAALSPGFGSLVNKGGNLIFREVRIGADGGAANTPYGHGSLIHESGTLVISNLFYFGVAGNAYFKADADFTVRNTTYFGFRGNINETATQLMELGAITASFQAISIGWNANNAQMKSRLILRGTTLEHTGLNTRNNSNAAGSVRGWGTITGSTITNNGKIIADAEGVDGRDLDVTFYTTLGLNVNTIIGPGNGWYAVNKGRLLLPPVTTTQNSGTATHNLGLRNHTNFYATDLGLYGANCLRLQLTGQAAGTIRPSLLAADHSDIPARKKLPGIVRSVWNIETPLFTRATANFRYDETAVRDPSLLWLMRYNPATQAWGRVAITWNNTMLHFTTEALFPQGATNLGFFALVEIPPTTLFFVK